MKNFNLPKAIAFCILTGFTALSINSFGQWTRISNSPAANRIYFYNAQVGYSLSHDKIYKTTDGGNTWNNIPTGLVSNTSINNIVFASADTGLIWTTDMNTFLYPASVYITKNGGTSWNKLFNVQYTEGSVEFSIKSSTDWFIHASSPVPVNNPADTIYQTTDAGNSWIKTGHASKAQYNQLINRLAVYKDSVTSGNTNLFYQSTDWGNTWNLLLRDSGSYGFTDYHFLNANEGFVLVNDTISKVYRTDDGGLTWNTYPLPIGCNPAGIYFTDMWNGYVISNSSALQKGQIFSTTDGGQTWSVDFSANTNEYFQSSQFNFNDKYGIYKFYSHLYVLGDNIIKKNLPLGIDCNSFCVKKIEMDTTASNSLMVTIFIGGDSTAFIDYPYVEYIVDNNGDTIANNGTANLFGAFGNQDISFQIPTTLGSVPANLQATVYFSYGDTSGIHTCPVPFPCPTTGINLINQGQSKIYPNPSGGNLTVELGSDWATKKINVLICNSLGEKIYESAIQSSKSGVDITSQPNGFYFLYLKSEGTMTVKKLVIAK